MDNNNRKPMITSTGIMLRPGATYIGELTGNNSKKPVKTPTRVTVKPERSPANKITDKNDKKPAETSKGTVVINIKFFIIGLLYVIIIGGVIHWLIYNADFSTSEKPVLSGKENVSGGALECPKSNERSPANTNAGRNKSENHLNGLQVQAIKTGFYEHKDLSSFQELYVPTVILKIKNISGRPLEEDLKVRAVFINDDEEMDDTFKYFQSSFKNPLQSGLSRQISLMCSRGWTSMFGLEDLTVVCQLYIGEKPYQTVRISNRLLTSTVIQTNDSSLDYDITVKKRQRMDEVLEDDNDPINDEPMIEYGSEDDENYSSSRLLVESDLTGLSKKDLRIMRNGIFARYGYIFKSKDLQEYFSRQSWYVPRYTDVWEQLTEIEKENVAFIKRHE